ncbi:MAG: hypothetical protein R8K48_01505 [Gallionella sp.]
MLKKNSLKYLFGLLGLLGCVVPLVCNAATFRVLLVLSDRSPIYQQFALNFAQNLPKYIHFQKVQRAGDFDKQAADLIVSVGVMAANRVALKSMQPLLAAMIPSNTYANLLRKRPLAVWTTAIYLDQPWQRKINFLHVALPENHKIGLLYSDATHLDLTVIRRALAHQQATLIDRPLRNRHSLSADLNAVLAKSNVLLAVPDTDVYNGNTMRNILLSSYRRDIPMVGFSAAYVRAGALCALFSTPEQLAAQASVSTVFFSKTGKLPVPQYPKLYTIAVNLGVARTLNINIQSIEALHLQLEQLSESSQ